MKCEGCQKTGVVTRKSRIVFQAETAMCSGNMFEINHVEGFFCGDCIAEISVFFDEAIKEKKAIDKNERQAEGKKYWVPGDDKDFI